ncbi:MAG TPA: zf-HC2 domain-containing protein [Sandaracinaceae bacterium LLY-WYZ-13_1]|nr:zf-HC2 domain-containing protein [Sandaracinaceae bacterium LLY-WYZ-13_1]
MIALARLVDWVTGDAAEDEVAEVEQHVMGCDACARTADRLMDLGDAVAALARDGALRHAATPSVLARMDADGLDVRRYDVRPGEAVECQATPTQAYAITWLRADLSGVASVDVEVAAEGGPVLDTVRDVPFDRREGAVVLVEDGDSIRALPRIDLRLTMRGRDASGEERELGTYLLRHSPAA